MSTCGSPDVVSRYAVPGPPGSSYVVPSRPSPTDSSSAVVPVADRPAPRSAESGCVSSVIPEPYPFRRRQKAVVSPGDSERCMHPCLDVSGNSAVELDGLARLNVDAQDCASAGRQDLRVPQNAVALP